MKSTIRTNVICATFLTAILVVQPPVSAQDNYDELQQKFERLNSEFKIMKKEIEELRTQLKEQTPELEVTTREFETLKEEIKKAGEWKTNEFSVHLTGYASVGYTDADSDDGTFELGTFSPIFHYLYKDLFLFESELEFELDQEEDGRTETEVEIEYLAIDWFMNDYMILVVGKFLSPIGQFRQNLHPDWINKLPSAPIGFGHDGATPLAEVGLQFRGGFPIGAGQGNYAFYIGNGPVLEVEREDPMDPASEFEIEAVETDGLVDDMNDNKIIGGRIGFLPVPNFEFAISGATGTADAADNDARSAIGDRNYDVFGADFNYVPKFIKNLSIRGEFVRSELGNGENGKDDPVKKDWEAWYLQGTYRVDPARLELVLRYGETNFPQEQQTQWAPGINYLFANNVIAKMAYEFNDTDRRDRTEEENRLLLQLAFGF